MIDFRITTYHNSKVCLLANDLSVDELVEKFDHPELYLPEMAEIGPVHRKKEFLGLRLALKYCLDGEEKVIVHTADGKPILTDNSFKISFSHCKHWITVMAHPTHDVGIDIERSTEQILKIHTRFLGVEELETYHKTHDINYLRVVWSTKEALYKIIGERAYNFAKKIRVLPFELKQKGELKAIFVEDLKEFNVRYEVTDSYTLAYSVDNE